MNTIELIKDAAFFGGHIPNERLDECRNFFDNVIEKQLTLTDVSQQRELLIAFAKYMEEDKMYERHDEANVDDFLDNNSN